MKTSSFFRLQTIHKFLGVLVLFFLSTCLFAQSTTDRADKKVEEIAKKLEIYDTQLTGRMKQAAEQYYLDLDEAEKIQDPTKKKVKLLRTNQQFDSKMKSLMTPEQAKFYTQMRNAENNPKPPAKKETVTTKPKNSVKSKKTTKKSTKKKATKKKKGGEK